MGELIGKAGPRMHLQQHLGEVDSREPRRDLGA
jgi:hypothetical protein